MQAIPAKRYTLFLQSRCEYGCGDHERSAFNQQERAVAGTHQRPGCLR
jgi:hypothetical protein